MTTKARAPRRLPRASGRELRAALQRVYEMAREISFANEYAFVDDETGERLGRDRNVLEALNAVRTHFGLKGGEER